jgi:predicted RNA-binding protein
MAKSHYVFTISGAVQGQRIAAIELLRDRLSRCVWPLNRLTPHQSKFQRGDRVLFYIAGGREPEQGHIVALSEISGERFVSERRDARFPGWIGVPEPPLYDVPLNQSEWFTKPVSVRHVLNRLTFIRNRKAWGTYFQGGVRRIPAKDFELIISLGLHGGS